MPSKFVLGFFRSKAATFVLGGILVLVLIGSIVLRRPRSLRAEGTRLLAALSDGDADALYEAASPEETSATHLTRDKFRRIYREILGPAIHRFRSTAPPETQIEMSGSEVIAYQMTKDAFGHDGEIGVSAFATSEGAKVSLTSPLFEAWDLDFVWSRGLKPKGQARKDARKLGLARDSARLTQIGIQGVYDMQQGRVVPWAEL